MIKWHKYYIDPAQRGKIFLPIDQDFQDHANAIGLFHSDEACKSKSDFFKKYFWGYHEGRLENYDKFLRQHLKIESEILSVAGGRCANELYLLENGYKVVCSDLQASEVVAKTKEIFPNFSFLELDVLKGGMDRQFDAVISLSLIYLFNERDLIIFFRNVSKLLKPGGQFILDSAGSPDNFYSHLIHEVLLKYEARLRWVFKSILDRKRLGFVIKHHGYRRTDAEIIECAKQEGFALLDQQNYNFLTEFRRSGLLRRIIKMGSFMEKMFENFGKKIPYVRMFNFQKIS